jgi:hypothetical protein
MLSKFMSRSFLCLSSAFILAACGQSAASDDSKPTAMDYEDSFLSFQPKISTFSVTSYDMNAEGTNAVQIDPINLPDETLKLAIQNAFQNFLPFALLPNIKGLQLDPAVASEYTMVVDNLAIQRLTADVIAKVAPGTPECQIAIALLVLDSQKRLRAYVSGETELESGLNCSADLQLLVNATHQLFQETSVKVVVK